MRGQGGVEGALVLDKGRMTESVSIHSPNHNISQRDKTTTNKYIINHTTQTSKN